MLDWFAATFTLLQIHLYGNETTKRAAAVIGMVACALWIIVGVQTNMKGVIALNFAIYLINFYNFIKFSRKELVL